LQVAVAFLQQNQNKLQLTLAWGVYHFSHWRSGCPPV